MPTAPTCGGGCRAGCRGGCCAGRNGKVQRQGAAVGAESGGEWRGVVAWRGGVGGAEGVQQGRSPAGRRVRFAGCCGEAGGCHRATEEAVDRALAEDHVALVGHLHATRDARSWAQPSPSCLPPSRARAAAASVGAWAEARAARGRCACNQGEMLSKQALTASWLASFKQSTMGIRSAHRASAAQPLGATRETAWRARTIRLEHRHIANSLAHPPRPRVTHHAPAECTGRSSQREH